MAAGGLKFGGFDMANELRGDKIYNIYVGPRPRHIPPSALVRRWDTSALGGLTVGALVGGVAWLALWHPLPFIGDPPAGGLWLNTKALAGAVWGTIAPQSPFAQSWGGSFHAWASQVSFATAYARPIIACALGLAAGAGIFAASLVPVASEFVVGGVRVLSGKAAKQEARAVSKRLASKQDPAWVAVHPDLVLPRSHIARHLLFAGSPGSGKTVALWPIIDQLYLFDAKAIIADTKGDFTSGVRSAGTLLICPWDKRSAVWDVCADIDTFDRADSFSKALIPASKEAYFSNGARQVLRGICCYLIGLYEKTGKAWDWQDLDRVRCLPPAELHKILINVDPGAAAIIDPSTEKQASINHNNLLVMTDPVIGTLARAWGGPLDDDGKPRKKWSVRAWCRDDYTGPKRIILQTDGKPAPFVGAIVDCAASVITSPTMEDSRSRALFFVLDELPSYGRLESLPALIDKGRSKGAVVLIGLQDVSQLKELYGAEVGRALVSMCATPLIFQVAPGETREILSKQIGKIRVAVMSESVSSSMGGSTATTAYHETERDAILSSDLTDTLGPRKGGKEGFFVRALVVCDGSVMRLDFPGYKARKLRKSRVPAAWTLGKTGSHGIGTGAKALEQEPEHETEKEEEKQQQARPRVVGASVPEAVKQEPGADKELGPATEFLADAIGFGGALQALEFLDEITDAPKKRGPIKPIITTTPGD